MKPGSSLLLILLALLLVTSPTFAQSGLPPAEPDTEAFLDVNFILQDTYSRVLCVAGDASCPAEVTTAVPCLSAGCAHAAQTYPVGETFDTIQAGVDAAQPGDLVIIMPGRYAGVQVEETGGTDGAYIHLLGWGDPGSVIVDRPARPDVSFLRHHFYFIAAHHYIIQNLAFERADRGAGLFFSGYFSGTGQFAHHLIISDVYSHDNYSWGLHTTSASYLVIQDSIFTNSADEHGAYLSGSGDQMVVRRNIFQGNNAAGLQVNADPQTATMEVFYWLAESTGDTCGWSEEDVEFEGRATWDDLWACYQAQHLPDLGAYFEDGISEGLIIEQNVITGNGSAGGAGINLASVRDSIVRGNLLYGNFAAGIACWDNAYAEEKGLPSSAFGCQRVTIANNTLVDEAGNRGALILNQDARDLAVFNNVIVRDRFDAYEVTGRSGQGLRSDHNALSALAVEDSPGTLLLDDDPGSGSLMSFGVDEALAWFVAPGFSPWLIEDGPWPVLNPARPDFHPLPGSPLATAGDPTRGPIYDLSGTLRARSEIGALAVGEAQAAAPDASAAEATPQDTPANAGTITYSLPDGTVWRIGAYAGATPERVSTTLDALSPGTEDEELSISADGRWLALTSDRFDERCAGWPCLVVLTADLSAWEVPAPGGDVIHPASFAAIGTVSSGLVSYPLMVYAGSDGPHVLDLYATRRTDSDWSAPQLLTAASPYAWNDMPHLSADASRVVFDCGDEPYGASGTAICEASTDGSGLRVVLTPADAPPGLTAGGALHHPAFAPDDAVIFEGTWNQGEQIWRLAAGAATPELLSGEYGNDNSPCVLPDGRIASLWL
ncbi:MAG: right-handed parallel beta-helix repeat-containing protein, partial [Anaerolineae bacterium]|nr:right-handed parallel beta-helix repeat-containing protein [Anaerolineae bacterium]